MKFQHAKAVVLSAFRANRPVMLASSPGIGKSALAHEVAAEYAAALAERTGTVQTVPVIEVRATLIDPVDLRGMPTIYRNGTGARTEWARPSFLPASPCILFFDEINAAPPMVQASLYQPMLLAPDGHRYVGEHRLHEDTRIIAAGNLISDRAVVQEMPTPLRVGRLVRIKLDADLEDFCAWGQRTGRVEPVVEAFVRFRPDLLHAFDPDAETSPAPRSWEVLSDFLRAGYPDAVEHDLVTGILGAAAATEFVAFARIWRTLPMPADVMNDPADALVPTDLGARYAITLALAAHAADAERFASALQYVRRISREFEVLFVKSACGRSADLQETRPFIEWATANADLFK